MKYNAVIYSLKRQYSVQATLVHYEDPQVDVASGSVISSETIVNIGQMIVLPSRVIAASLSVFRSKEHPSGAFYLRHEVVGLVDRKSLYKDLNISVGDRINNYSVAGVLNLYGELFIEVGLTDLSKVTV